MTAVGTRARWYDKMAIQRITKTSQSRTEIKSFVSVSQLSCVNRSAGMLLRTRLRRGLVFLQNAIVLVK